MDPRSRVIQSSLKISLGVYLLGLAVFAAFKGWEECLWFGIGGGMALFNFFLAAIFIRLGLAKFRNSAGFLVLLMLKSLAFVALVAVVLMLTKPLLLPFTLGIGLVIFGAVIWAVLESRHYFKQDVKEG